MTMNNEDPCMKGPRVMVHPKRINGLYVSHERLLEGKVQFKEANNAQFASEAMASEKQRKTERAEVAARLAAEDLHDINKHRDDDVALYKVTERTVEHPPEQERPGVIGFGVQGCARNVRARERVLLSEKATMRPWRPVRELRWLQRKG
ncbi:hypothetical protein YC2023_047267 [Brassica napus]